jgi:hypothetical protein
VAAGDVNGDCYPDIVVAAGPQVAPYVKVYDGRNARLGTLTQIASFFAYEASFTGGVYVAVADMNGDGKGEVITGAGKPSTARVRVFSGAGISLASPPQLFPEIVAFDSTLKLGARVAAGDYNGDGQMDIAVTFGSGAPVRVRVINGATLANGFQPASDLLDDFLPFEATFKRGAYLSMVDLNGDGRQEIQVSRSSEPILQNQDFTIGTSLATLGEVRSFSYDGINHLGGSKAADFSIFPYAGDGSGSFNSGVRLGAWFDSATVSFFLTAPGKDQPGHIRQLSNFGATNTLFASEAFTQGYFVAGSKRNDGRIVV